MRASAVLVALVLSIGLHAQAAAQAPLPIPGDGDWTLITVPGGGCYARLAGRDFDTMVMVNRDTNPVLSIGRPDWHLGTTDLTAQLRIDMGPVRQVAVSPVDTIFLLVIQNDLHDAVLNAKSMTWTLPNGTFSGGVAGLGKAFRAVIPCGLAAALAVPPPN